MTQSNIRLNEISHLRKETVHGFDITRMIFIVRAIKAKVGRSNFRLPRTGRSVEGFSPLPLSRDIIDDFLDDGTPPPVVSWDRQ
jgi:hypothetical protein